MGVEFTGAPTNDRRAQVEELIGRLISKREVPKIFVGRKEGRSPASNPASEMARRDESPDPLLELVREGASLSVEQFLCDLRAQRLATVVTQD